MKPQDIPMDEQMQSRLHFFADDSLRRMAGRIGLNFGAIYPFRHYFDENYSLGTATAAFIDKNHTDYPFYISVFRAEDGTGENTRNPVIPGVPPAQTPRIRRGVGELFVPIGTYAFEQGAFGASWVPGITSLTALRPNQSGTGVEPYKQLIGSTLAENFVKKPARQFGFTYDTTANEPYGERQAVHWDRTNHANLDTNNSFQIAGFLDFSPSERHLFEEVKRRVSKLQ